jgi:lysylphosphatidylglycerol synthetase-like protein (DUF2156 family)
VLQFVPCGNDGLFLDLVRRHHADLENWVMELMIAKLLTAARSRRINCGSLSLAVFLRWPGLSRRRTNSTLAGGSC